jgi:hypothetical protein
VSERMREREATALECLTALVCHHGTVEVHRVGQHFAVCVGEEQPRWYDAGTVAEAIADAAHELPSVVSRRVQFTVTEEKAA